MADAATEKKTSGEEKEAGAPEEGQEKPDADEASDEQAKPKKKKSWRDWLPF